MSQMDMDLRADALGAIQDVCEVPMQYIRTENSGYNPETGSVGAVVVTEVDVWGLQDGASLKTMGTYFAPGTLIEAGDIVASVPVQPDFEADPNAGDQMRVRGATWTVKGFRPVMGTDLVVMWQILLRRGA